MRLLSANFGHASATCPAAISSRPLRNSASAAAPGSPPCASAVRGPEGGAAEEQKRAAQGGRNEGARHRVTLSNRRHRCHRRVRAAARSPRHAGEGGGRARSRRARGSGKNRSGGTTGAGASAGTPGGTAGGGRGAAGRGRPGAPARRAPSRREPRLSGRADRGPSRIRSSAMPSTTTAEIAATPPNNRARAPLRIAVALIVPLSDSEADTVFAGGAGDGAAGPTVGTPGRIDGKSLKDPSSCPSGSRWPRSWRCASRGSSAASCSTHSPTTIPGASGDAARLRARRTSRAPWRSARRRSTRGPSSRRRRARRGARPSSRRGARSRASGACRSESSSLPPAKRRSPVSSSQQDHGRRVDVRLRGHPAFVELLGRHVRELALELPLARRLQRGRRPSRRRSRARAPRRRRRRGCSAATRRGARCRAARPARSCASCAACRPWSSAAHDRAATIGSGTRSPRARTCARAAASDSPWTYSMTRKSSPSRGHDVERRHDVGVADARGEARLVEEHRDELGVLRELRVQALDRDRAREAAGPEEARRGAPSPCRRTRSRRRWRSARRSVLSRWRAPPFELQTIGLGKAWQSADGRPGSHPALAIPVPRMSTEVGRRSARCDPPPVQTRVHRPAYTDQTALREGENYAARSSAAMSSTRPSDCPERGRPPCPSRNRRANVCQSPDRRVVFCGLPATTV